MDRREEINTTLPQMNRIGKPSKWMRSETSEYVQQEPSLQSIRGDPVCIVEAWDSDFRCIYQKFSKLWASSIRTLLIPDVQLIKI